MIPYLQREKEERSTKEEAEEQDEVVNKTDSDTILRSGL